MSNKKLEACQILQEQEINVFVFPKKFIIWRFICEMAQKCIKTTADKGYYIGKFIK